MAQSLVLSGVALQPQSLTISGVATGSGAQSITISGVAHNGQSLTISGVASAPQSLVISGTAKSGLTISGFASFPITFTPSSVAFSQPTSASQVVSISQGTLSGPYTATSSNTGIATVSVSGTSLIVVPIATGSATITVSGSSATATLSITVGAAAGSLVVSTGVLNLNTGGAAQTFTVSRSGDTGAFTVSASPSGIVSVTGSGNAPGPITYTVTPLMSGTANITVTTADGVTDTFPVYVTGTLTAAVTSPKHATNLTIAVSELGYSGTITPSFVGTTTATISPSVGFGPRQTFTISDASAGETFLIEFQDVNGSQAFLSLQTRDISLGPVVYIFFDETGINPVAPGSQYTVYYVGDPQVSSSVVASGFLFVGGTAALTLDQTTDYVVVWSGQQAPTTQTAFTTPASGATTYSVTVTGYCSPNYSTLGYAAQQLSNWTRGWVGDSYKQPGPPGTTGLAYSLAYSFASILGDGGTLNGIAVPGLDRYLQNISVSTRLLNCTGLQIDSFFADYLGASFKRQIGESDQAFITRGLVALNNEVATRQALNDATNAAWATLGNSGTIVCDDEISNPTLLSGLSLTAPHFVVLLPTVSTVTDAFLLNYRYLGVNTYLLALGTIQTIDPSTLPTLLTEAVESKRALGTIPVYCQYIS